MLSEALYNYLLNNNNYSYGLDESVVASNNSEGKVPKIRTKTLYRSEQTLSYNVTLLIELGIVLIVITVVGLVFYFSHRSFKKRNNIHRRRWLESDINIDNYSDGQIYDPHTSTEEYQPQSIDFDRDDCPPPYEQVVQQTRPPSTSTEKWAKRPKKSKKHGAKSEPLIRSSQSLNCISTICNENSLLIGSQQHLAASTSLADDEACTDISGREGSTTVPEKKSVSDDRKVERLSSDVGRECGKESKKMFHIDTKRMVKCESGIALLDASGLPTYDTALKIQECGIPAISKAM